ncbi:glycosyltransferase family 61 protein [Natronorubrum tibetense]|uniref:glycosyltransferase family 61 protein n=1 Tax=Natronorubrum tibetense TaxID=63128 RepID=UPI001F4C65A2|nr:glycosyltransferase family 61 protein [Natronorubrum tibetense]
MAAVLHRKSSVQNFYHWLIERLLTLRGVSHYQEQTGTSVSLIVTRDAPGFVYDFIDHLGFSDNEIIRWDGGPIRADKIVVPSWPELTASGLEWLRERMVASVPAQQNSVEYVYVSRQRTAQRKVTNFDEIEPILWSYDVEPIFLGDISLEEEINLLRSADGIVGPHGAGLTGMIWPDHTKVLELFNGVVIPPFYLMADLLGHQYESILGEPAEMERSRRHRNTYIAPEEFEERLAGFVNAD